MTSYSYTMTEAETRAWESDDARVRDEARREIRARVRACGGGEVYSADGIVMDAVRAHAYRPIAASLVPQHVRDGRWDTPRPGQGQMVTVSYAAESRYEAGPGARYRRTHDASVSGYYGHEYRYEILEDVS